MKQIRSALILVVLLATSFSSFAFVTTCEQTFSERADEIPDKANGEFRIMQFNVEDLIREMTPEEAALSAHPDSIRRAKSDSKTREIVELTERHEPDVAVWEEVQDLKMMKSVQLKFGMKDYIPYSIPGNDEIGIGMWLKKDLNYQVKYETHKNVMWNDPAKEGRSVKLFTRDVPAMILTKAGNTKPDLIILGVHAKSMRDREGDPLSTSLRTAQFAGERDIIEAYKQKYGVDVSIVAVGDHNTDVRNSEELNPVREVMIDGFEAAPNSIAVEDRGTHYYFPKNPDEPSENNQLDAIMISRDSNLIPVRARVVPYRSFEDIPRGAPTSFQDRKTQPSDHHAVIVDLKLAS